MARNTITPSVPITLGVPLMLAGTAFPVPVGATVTAQLFSQDQTQPLSSVLSPNVNAIGADWNLGLIVCEFSATDTYTCSPPVVALVVTVASNGDTRQFVRIIPVAETAPLQSIMTSMDVAEFRTDRLVNIARQYFPRIPLSDAYVFRKLLAAEALTARELRIFMKPTQVLPPSMQTQAIEAGFTSQGIPIYEEPGYDYDPAFFSGNSWGWMDLRNRPSIAVQSFSLNYPSELQPLMEIPLDWIRMEKKYGRISLVPTNTIASISLDGYLMSVLGGGRVIPLSIMVQYTAGLANARGDYPDLIDVIYKRTALAIIEDKFLPASASVSGDGLSQSMSFAAKDHAERIAATISTLRGSIGGATLLVL